MNPSPNLPRLIAIVGPTASGKSSLALRLARKFQGEIVSADSMQVYRGLDIGTAKPTREERQDVPHHLIDILEPDQPYSAALFRKQAMPIIAFLHKNRTPTFIVGGTGLYVKALTRGLFQGPGARPEMRQALKERGDREGSGALHQDLERLDPSAASRIHRGDTFRIIRALEVYFQASKPISLLQEEHGFKEAPYATLKIGVFREREELYRRIDERVDQMIALGWAGEVKSLLRQGFSRDLKPMMAIGYRHLSAHLYGERGFAESVERIKRDTRRFAKRQLTWFRADDEIRWMVPTEENVSLLEKRVEEFLHP
jgi:tRNA dimethylallyltransferase